jgi:hypothetical protein
MLLVSFGIYAFPASSLLVASMGLPTMGLYFLTKKYIGTSVNVVFMYAGLLILLVSFLLLSTPTVAAINQTMIDQNATMKEQVKMGVQILITELSAR